MDGTSCALILSTSGAKREKVQCFLNCTNALQRCRVSVLGYLVNWRVRDACQHDDDDAQLQQHTAH